MNTHGWAGLTWLIWLEVSDPQLPRQRDRGLKWEQGTCGAVWCVANKGSIFNVPFSSGRSKHQSLFTHFGQSHFLAVGEVAGKAEARLHSLSGLHPYVVDVWGMGRHQGIKAAMKMRMVVLQRWLAYFLGGIVCYSLGDIYLSATGAKLLLYHEIVIG